MFVFDIDKNGGLVGIEVLSVPRLQKNFAEYSRSKEENFSPEMIPAYIIPFVLSPHNAKKVFDFTM